jgi:hypothetical protein
LTNDEATAAGAAMKRYRIYELNKRGRPIGSPRLIECETNEQVIAEAYGLLRHRALEISRRSDLTLRVEPKQRPNAVRGRDVRGDGESLPRYAG